MALATIIASPAAAHVSLENRQAAVGGSYKAVFAVPHGCAGSATTKIRVQIPEGVIAVKPMPKAGWSVEAIKGKYAAELRSITARNIPKASRRWCGAVASLPDDHYDEFVVSTFLTASLKPNTTLYFPVVQECEQGISRWIDIPAPAMPAIPMTDKSPAPGVKLMPKP